MGNELFEKETKLFRQVNHETVCIEPWGKDGLRIRSTVLDEIKDLPGALVTFTEVQRNQSAAGAKAEIAINVSSNKGS